MTPFHLTDDQVAAVDDAAHVAGIAAGIDVELTLDPCVGFDLSASPVDVPFFPTLVSEIRAHDALDEAAVEALLDSVTLEYHPALTKDGEGPFPYSLAWPLITGGSPAEPR